MHNRRGVLACRDSPPNCTGATDHLLTTRCSPLPRPPRAPSRFLSKHVGEETLAIADSKLGSVIKDKLNLTCVYRFVSRSLTLPAHPHPFSPSQI